MSRRTLRNPEPHHNSPHLPLCLETAAWSSPLEGKIKTLVNCAAIKKKMQND